MPFYSLEQILQAFHLPKQDADEVRKELRRRLKQVHPDTNSTTGAPSAASDEVLRITEALNFLDAAKRRTAVVPVEEVTDLVKAIKELLPANREQDADAKLAGSIDAKAEEAKSSGRLLRAFLTAGALFLTVIWLFPSIAGSHPILRKYINVEDTLFTVVWLSLLLYTGAIWLVYKLWRQRDIDTIKSLKLEFTQLRLFKNFLHAKASHQDSAKPAGFYKDEFVSYLEGAEERFSPAASGISGRGKHIDAELAQMLAENLLLKAESRGVLRKDGRQSLRVFYHVIAGLDDL